MARDTWLLSWILLHAVLSVPARLHHRRVQRPPVPVKLLQQLLLLLLDWLCNSLACCCTLHELMLGETCNGNCRHCLQQPVHCHHLQ